MGKYVNAGKTGEFTDGAMKKVPVAGQSILLVKVGGSYYAVSNRCPHLGGDLSAGTLEGTVVTCPRHGSQFDLRDGRNIRWLKGTGFVSAVSKVIKPPGSLRTYEIKIDGDNVMVEV